MAEEIRGQTLLFMLFGLAANAMSYPSTLASEKTSFSLYRASPLVCVVDSAAIIAFFFYGLFKGYSLRDAITVATDLCGFSSIEQSPGSGVLRLCTMGFASLPALLTLVGSHGVPWTAAWGVMYVVSNAISGVFVTLGCTSDRPRSDVVDISAKRAKWLQGPAAVYIMSLHVLATAWIADQMMQRNPDFDLDGVYDSLTGVRLGLYIMLMCVFVVMTAVGVYLTIPRENWGVLERYWMVMLPWLSGIGGIVAVFIGIVWRVTMAALIACFSLLLFTFTILLIEDFAPRLGWLRLVDIRGQVAVLVYCILQAVLYYIAVYESGGTWKSSWTKSFG